jgi:hypothetical protein
MLWPDEHHNHLHNDDAGTGFALEESKVTETLPSRHHIHARADGCLQDTWAHMVNMAGS